MILCSSGILHFYVNKLQTQFLAYLLVRKTFMADAAPRELNSSFHYLNPLSGEIITKSCKLNIKAQLFFFIYLRFRVSFYDYQNKLSIGAGS